MVVGWNAICLIRYRAVAVRGQNFVRKNFGEFLQCLVTRKRGQESVFWTNDIVGCFWSVAVDSDFLPAISFVAK